MTDNNLRKEHIVRDFVDPSEMEEFMNNVTGPTGDYQISAMMRSPGTGTRVIATLLSEAEKAQRDAMRDMDGDDLSALEDLLGGLGE